MPIWSDSRYKGSCAARLMFFPVTRTKSYRNVEDVLARFEMAKSDYYRKATEQIAAMLRKEYPEKEPSLQQLSAVFRRGELLGLLG